MKKLAIIFLALYSGVSLRAQVVLQNTVMGKAVVSDPTSVKMTPGFHAVEGSLFRAYIGSPQGSSSSYTVPAPSSSATPAAGSSGNNYIKTITYREPKASIPSSGSYKHSEEIRYFDGLGRPVQTVSVGASPSGYDIIQPILYDDFGRKKYKPLPYATTARTGAFRSGVDQTTVSSLYSNPSSAPAGVEPSGRAYTQTGYDNSPLNRVTSQTGPGAAWASKPVTINYLTNTPSDPVPGWKVSSTGSFTSFTYPGNSLYVTETIDEQGNATREYKDKQGRVVQKSSKNGSAWLRTAYIYDDLNLLRCVVPPEATDPGSQAGLCYYYKYDERRRMVEKKIPGGGTIKMVYDKRDRLRCIQDSMQAARNEWSFIKYDVLNRPIITGTINNYTSGINALKNAVNSQGLQYEIRNTSSGTLYGYTTYYMFPTSSFTILTVTYYDDYNFITDLSLNDSLNSSKFDGGSYNFASKTDLTPKGRVTGTMTRVLSASADNGSVPLTTLYTTTYYDKYGLVLRTISDNHLKGKDVISYLYEDITYLVQKSRQQHYKGGKTLTIEKFFEYDHTGRLLATRQKVNTQAEITLSAMKYNELGQLITKYLHSDQVSGSRTFVQKVDYNYNIRGWLTKINDPALTGENDQFGMQLCYENKTPMGTLGSSATPYYNGNISGIKWGIKNDVIRGFIVTYDSLNRLKATNYAEGSSLNANTGYYTESVSLYDKNGNIKKLQRKYKNKLVDNLTYIYNTNSNQLQRVTDSGLNDDPVSSEVEDYPGNSLDYTYDGNGNMITDGSRNTTLTYHNTLNLPASVDFGSNNRIFYHYTAGGTKLLKHVVTGSGTLSKTHYIGNIVYEGGTLSYLLTEEGRMVNTGTAASPFFVHEYNLKDHLGNNRVTFLGKNLPGGAVELVQTMDYYPFGLSMTPQNANPSSGYSKNKYLYNGKEIQDDKLNGTFFGMLDYGARFYDPQLGRWHSVDPLAEKFPTATPYNYCFNNPIALNDPNGMDPTEEEKKLITYYQQFYPWVKTIDDVKSIVNGQTQQPNSEQDNMSKNSDQESNQNNTFLGDVIEGTPFVGPMKSYFETWNEGYYLNAIGYLGLAITDVADFGTATLFKFVEKNAAKQLEKVSVKLLAQMGVKSFTERNFRKNLIKLTGKNLGKLYHAHHVFPQELMLDFAEKGIDVNLPIFGVWWKADSHLKNAASYNQQWKDFLVTNPSTGKILEEGRKMMEKYGIKVNY